MTRDEIVASLDWDVEPFPKYDGAIVCAVHAPTTSVSVGILLDGQKNGRALAVVQRKVVAKAEKRLRGAA